jgi:hypothetical protein
MRDLAGVASCLGILCLMFTIFGMPLVYVLIFLTLTGGLMIGAKWGWEKLAKVIGAILLFIFVSMLFDW